MRSVGSAPLEPNRMVCAVLGVPNSGVTTTVNALARQSVPTSNVPLQTTASAPFGVSEADARTGKLAEKLGLPAVPANLTFLDSPGVHEAADPWTKAQWADAGLVVLRAFEAAEVVHLEDTVDPIRDLEQVLAAAMRADRTCVAAAQKKKHDAFATEVLDKLLAQLVAGNPVRAAKWNTREEDVIIPLKLITAKPLVYLINLSDPDFVRQKSKWLPKVAKWVKEHDEGAPMVPYSAVLEERLSGMDAQAASAHRQEVGIAKSMRCRIVEAAYAAARVARFYTITSDVRVWAVPEGSKAPRGAACVHSDFEQRLQGLEAAPFDEYMADGKLHQKGKDYVVLDGDVIHFKVKSVAGSPTNKGKSPTKQGQSPTNKGKVPGSPSKSGYPPSMYGGLLKKSK